MYPKEQKLSQFFQSHVQKVFFFHSRHTVPLLSGTRGTQFLSLYLLCSSTATNVATSIVAALVGRQPARRRHYSLYFAVISSMACIFPYHTMAIFKTSCPKTHTFDQAIEPLIPPLAHDFGV